MNTLKNYTLHTILNNQNGTEALRSLWNTPEFVIGIIRTQKCNSVIDRILYSLDPKVLREVWGCPDEHLHLYAQNCKINKYLDSIILGKTHFDLMKCPIAILKMLDHRESQISHTHKYRKHFGI